MIRSLGTSYYNNGNQLSSIRLHTRNTQGGYYNYYDAIGFDWLSNYSINQNLQYGIETNGFYNEFILLNESYEEIISISCLNGSYYINGTSIDYNVFFNNSQYIYDSWSISIEINQLYENGTLFIYNESRSLQHIQYFNTNCSGNIKCIKYIQHYQNSIHFINTSNLIMLSNDTMIIGNNGFLLYSLDDLEWSFEFNDILNITGYGLYRIYATNQNFSIIYQLSNWIFLNNEEYSIYVGNLNYSLVNPYLLVETINGLYLFSNVKICNSETSWILEDDRGYLYDGTLTLFNVESNTSYFYIDINGVLRFSMNIDDNETEYMLLSFDVQNINNYNYRCIFDSYFDTINTDITRQMRVKHTDASSSNIDLGYGYNSHSETLEQDKTTHIIEFYISDNDLENNVNISGSIYAFTFNYSETIGFTVFVDNMLIMLLPMIVILALTITITYEFRDKSNKKEFLNKSMFFPIFVLFSIITFIIGMYDVWILFVILIATIVYLILKKDVYRK